MSSEEAETIAEHEKRAREELQRLVTDGKAIEILDTYYLCRQSCEYVYSIVHEIANASLGAVSGDVRDFARNLLDDWSK